MSKDFVINKSGLETNYFKTNASICSGNVFDSNNVMPNLVKAKDFSFKISAIDNSHDSNSIG